MQRHEVEILLVEDDPDDVELTLNALEAGRLTNRIQVARDGEEALDFLSCRGAFADRRLSDPPKLVLLDLKIPKVDGLEVLRQIKNDVRTKTTPVVILTSSREERDRLNGYVLGVNSYIRKPVDFDDFRATVQQLGGYWLLLNEPPPARAVAAGRAGHGDNGAG